MKYDSDYEVRLATLEAMGGDTTKCYDSVYEIDLQILKIIEEGGTGGGAQIDDNTISTTTTWSSSKIVSELANAGFDVQVVQTLPATGEAHTLYFVPSADPKTQNIYDEYLYANNAWEQVGSTAVDMSDYYTKTEIDTSINTALSSYATIANVDASLNLKADKTYVDASLNLKADKTYVDSSLANKANISYVDTNFAKLSVLTQAQYDALTTKDASTLYIISDAQ